VKESVAWAVPVVRIGTAQAIEIGRWPVNAMEVKMAREVTPEGETAVSESQQEGTASAGRGVHTRRRDLLQDPDTCHLSNAAHARQSTNPDDRFY